MDHFIFQATGRIVSTKRFGKKLAVRLASNYYDHKSKEEKTNYLDIDFIGKDADHVEKHFGQGDLIQARGRAANHSYEKDGETIYTTQLTVTDYDLMAFKKKED